MNTETFSGSCQVIMPGGRCAYDGEDKMEAMIAFAKACVVFSRMSGEEKIAIIYTRHPADDSEVIAQVFLRDFEKTQAEIQVGEAVGGSHIREIGVVLRGVEREYWEKNGPPAMESMGSVTPSKVLH